MRKGRREQAISIGGLSKARLGRMHDVLAGYVERAEVPGLTALVSRRGEVHVDAIGVKALGGSDPIRRDTICDLLSFRMGFGQMMAPPDSYPILKAANEQQIGMGPPMPQTMPAPDEWIRRMGTLPLMHQPGEKWMYNAGSDVLGVLIARASGQRLETFLRERIFAPLGMKDTGFSVPSTKLDRLATSYWTSPETGRSSPMTRPRAANGAARPPSRPVPAGWSRPSTTTWPSVR